MSAALWNGNFRASSRTIGCGSWRSVIYIVGELGEPPPGAQNSEPGSSNPFNHSPSRAFRAIRGANRSSAAINSGSASCAGRRGRCRRAGDGGWRERRSRECEGEETSVEGRLAEKLSFVVPHRTDPRGRGTGYAWPLSISAFSSARFEVSASRWRSSLGTCSRQISSAVQVRLDFLPCGLRKHQRLFDLVQPQAVLAGDLWGDQPHSRHAAQRVRTRVRRTANHSDRCPAAPLR